HCSDPRGNHVSGARTDDVNAENFIGLLVGQNLYEPVSIHAGASPSKCLVGETADLVLTARTLELFLRISDAGNFGPGINDTRDKEVIDVRFLTRQCLCDKHTLLLRFVRKHRTSYDIANSVYVVDISLQVIVDF